MQAEPLTVDRVRKALDEANGSVKRAAQILGVSRPTVYDWIEKHGIERVIKPRKVVENIVA